jgi:hypothetical protein
MPGKKPNPDDDRVDDPEAEDEAAREATDEILSPAMPPAGAGIALENDPRLNRPSETEAELKELVRSNEDAEEEARDEP